MRQVHPVRLGPPDPQDHAENQDHQARLVREVKPDPLVLMGRMDLQEALVPQVQWVRVVPEERRDHQDHPALRERGAHKENRDKLDQLVIISQHLDDLLSNYVSDYSLIVCSVQ